MNFLTLNIILIIGVVFGMLLMLKTISMAAAKYGIEPELKRKIAHVATGLVTLPAPWVFQDRYPVLIIVGLAIVAMAMIRSKWFVGRSMNTVLHDVQRKSFGEFYLLFAVGLLFMLSKDAPILFVLPICIVALSDAASALVGTKYGQRRLKVAGGKKSLEGVITFFVVTLIVSLITLMLMTDIPELNIILLSTLIAGFCAYVERDSWRGLDNLFVPIGAHLLLSKFLYASLASLSGGIIFIVAIFFIFRAFSPAMKLTEHGARSYAILIILILCATAAQNIILPIIAITAHLLARATHPAQGQNRDLEMIAATASVGMLWLFVGAFTADNTTNLFGLTYAGAAVIFSGLALPSKLRWIVIGLVPVLGLIYKFVVSQNPSASNWNVDPLILAGTALVLAFISILFFPKSFNQYRSVKTYAVAMTVPMGFYLTMAFTS